MPELKVTYFDMRGRAESIRLALTIGEVPFEDDRIEFSTWKELKPTTPYGSLPIMTVDGKVMAQSHAMLRYVGKLAGLYPEDALAALKVDEVLDVATDVSSCIYRYRGDDKERLREEREKLVQEDIPRYVGALEKRLEMFGDGPFAVGEGLTIADIIIANLVTMTKSGLLDFVPKDVLDAYPRFMKAYDAVMEDPKVVEWYKKHPIKIMS